MSSVEVGNIAVGALRRQPEDIERSSDGRDALAQETREVWPISGKLVPWICFR